MDANQARALGREIAAHLSRGDSGAGFRLLALVLAERTPFPKLGLIGEAAANCRVESLDAFLETVAANGAEGGWVVIGSALGQRLARDPTGALERCRRYVVACDAWFGADILGERVPGPALVTDFEVGLAALAPWRQDENPWLRRAVGVAAHYWTKRSRGTSELVERAEVLL